MTHAAKTDASSVRRIVLAAVLALVAGCRSSGDYRAEADREVYAILTERRAQIFSDRSEFSIEPAPDSLRQRILAASEVSMGPFSMAETLEIAAENSREYQRRKEDLYLSALDLTLERWRFRWQQSGIFGAFLDGTGGEATDASGTGDFGLSRALGTGALIVADLGFDVARSLSSGDGWKAVSDLGLTMTQPLLRGAGRSIVEENLTQAERNLVYEVRSYERFRRTFAVDVTGRLYRVLQLVDAVTNEEANYLNLTELRERNQALADAGRLSDIQVDQARQDELSSENRLLNLRASLEAQLDDFKLFLGLPTGVELRVDVGLLEALRLEGLAEVGLAEDMVTVFALANRLDYLTTLDRIEDAERAVHIDQDALRAGLGLRLDANVESADNNPLRYNAQDIDWTLGLDLDLPVERTIERNRFRESLIMLDRSRRDAAEFADTIRADLRDALREARATREENEIQRNSVQLAERRVESAKLNLEAGRVDTRDLLEAQEDLLTARNGAIRSRIDYTLARLALYRDMELLRVTPEGLRIDLELMRATPPDESTPPPSEVPAPEVPAREEP